MERQEKDITKIIHKTSQKKMKTKKQSAKQWIKENIQQKPTEIIKRLNIKLIGHYKYYGITDNYNKIGEFREYIIETLFKQLRRRGQKKRISWEKYNKILKYNPIIEAKIYVTINWKQKIIAKSRMT